VTHLTALRREGLISEWHDRKLRGGDDWAGEIDDELNRALVILLLISPDFIASDYCIDKELKRAMERHEAGEARVIPVIVRDFDREISPEVFPFTKLQFLPSEGKPIKQWDNENAAFVNVAKGIRAVVKPLADARRQAGEVRREPEVRFGWGGALRVDGAPRPWLKGIYLPGKRSDVVRMDDGDGAYVSLWSEESSFVLGTTAHVDLETHPFLSRRWMAIELPKKGDVRDSKRIDEALSLAVSFVDESGAWQQFYYGWDTAAPVGTIEGAGLFSLKWKLKVITSGAASLGEWAECRVNLREDIREVYGEDIVPKTVVMLMVQSNTQYTKGSGAGCMGEICFSTTK
jgi:hypothetical protein